jgi:hypothetical protein
VFPHDGDLYETLLATADSRMYRDKTRRKRLAGDAAPDSSSAPDADLKRSSISIL